MPHYKYLIVGGGITADAAVEGIRSIDREAAIGLIGAEPDPPYNRPPLSKGLWKGDALERIWRKTQARGVDLYLGRKAVSLDFAARAINDSQGARYTYEKLLLATGVTPRRLPSASGVIYYRALSDYNTLRALSGEGRSFAVIGGGFIGWEIAAALKMNGNEVVMIFPEETIGARLYPADLGRFLNRYYREKGVRIVAGGQITALEKTPRGARVQTQAHGNFEVDGVVAGIGVTPETSLAQAAGLKIDNGIMVDEFLRTSDPHIYAAGDVANFHNPILDRRLRVEHEDNANVMGRAAGANMAGGQAPYRHLPFFYSDLFELGYEAVGDLDPRLEIVADWKEPYREGVLYYLQAGRVRGVLLWNTYGQVDEARKLIAEPGPFRPADLKGRLPAA